VRVLWCGVCVLWCGVCVFVLLLVWVVAAVVLLFVCGCAVRVCVVFGRFRCAAVLVLCVCSRPFCVVVCDCDFLVPFSCPLVCFPSVSFIASGLC